MTLWVLVQAYFRGTMCNLEFTLKGPCSANSPNNDEPPGPPWSHNRTGALSAPTCKCTNVCGKVQHKTRQGTEYYLTFCYVIKGVIFHCQQESWLGYFKYISIHKWSTCFLSKMQIRQKKKERVAINKGGRLVKNHKKFFLSEQLKILSKMVGVLCWTSVV